MRIVYITVLVVNMHRLVIASVIIVVLILIYYRDAQLRKLNSLESIIKQQKADLQKTQQSLKDQSDQVDKCHSESKLHEQEVEITALKALIGDRYDQLEKINTTVDTYRQLVSDLKQAARIKQTDQARIDELAWTTSALQQRLLESQELIARTNSSMDWQRWRIARLQHAIYEATGPADPSAYTYVCGDKFDCHYFS